MTALAAWWAGVPRLGSRARARRPRRSGARVAAGLGVLLLACAGVACGNSSGHHGDPLPTASASAEPPVTIELRTTQWFTYPCLQCHKNREPNPNVRALTEFHTDKELVHGTNAGWCYRCHAKEDQGQLVLIDGTRVGFDASHELCGSCHGEKMRDWRQNLHGQTSGYWNGPKVRRSCTACHDPHNPKFKPMTPESPPPRPPGAGVVVEHGAK